MAKINVMHEVGCIRNMPIHIPGANAPPPNTVLYHTKNIFLFLNKIFKKQLGNTIFGLYRLKHAEKTGMEIWHCSNQMKELKQICCFHLQLKESPHTPADSDSHTCISPPLGGHACLESLANKSETFISRSHVLMFLSILHW